MIQVSLFRSSHGALDHIIVSLGVFALLCPESFGIGFLDTKRHLHELKNRHELTKRVKI